MAQDNFEVRPGRIKDQKAFTSNGASSHFQ